MIHGRIHLETKRERLPEAILPIKRFPKRVKGDMEDEYDSLNDDSEIEDILSRKPSPETPFAHSPRLLASFEMYIRQKYGSLDDVLIRQVSVDVMRRLDSLLEKTRTTLGHLNESSIGNGSFILALAKQPEISPAVHESAVESYRSLIGCLELCNINTTSS